MKQIVRAFLIAALCCLPLVIHGQTNCNITLPYSTGFETDASEQAPACWTVLGGTAYAFDFVYYAHTGSKILALNYQSAESKIATPRIPLPLNQVGVTLWYADLAWNPGIMRVGFVTSLTATNVQWIDTIPSSDDYTYFELDFTGLSITDTGYLVFAYNNANGTGSGMIDDITISRMSNCIPVTHLHVRELSNTDATIVWNESASSTVGCVCYIADTNSRQAAFDSVFVLSGIGEHTFTSLSGNKQYYVWVMNYCGDSYSSEATVSFVTNADCGSVQNLQAVSDYRMIGLSWDTPPAAEPTTGYRVEYRLATDTQWDSATTTNRYYFLTGLNPDSRYDYRVTTFCGDSTGLTATGYATTLGCTTTVKDSTSTHGSLPMSYSSNNSYTQQIYLASEMSGIDTITGLTFWIANEYNIDPTPVVVYLSNTAKSQFSSGTDYVPVGQLTQVFDGTITNNGREVTIRFDAPFVRSTDSNLLVAVDNNLDDEASTLPSFVVGSASYRGLYRTSLGDVNPSSPGFGSRASYVNRITFGTRGCQLPQCDRPIVCVAEVGDDYIDVAWSGDSLASYTCAYRLAGERTWTVADSATTGNSYRFAGLSSGNSYQLRISHVCGGDTLSGIVGAMLPCLSMAVPYTEDFESQMVNTRFERGCWKTGSLSTSYFSYYPTVVTLAGSTNKICQLRGSYIVLPQLSTPLDQLQVRFNLRQSSADNVLVLALLGSMDDTITTATVIDTFAFLNGDSLLTFIDTTVIYPLNLLGETEGHLVIMARQGGAYQFVDNIIVEEIPDCMPVTHATVSNITTTTATVNWTEPTEATSTISYIVEYGPRVFVPSTGIMQTTYGSSLGLSSLNHSSNYDVYIYTLCASDTASAFGPIRFSTLCDLQNQLPYVMNFDGIQSPDYTDQTLPNCWYGAAPSNGTVPIIVSTTDTTQATSGTYCLQFHGTGIATLPLFSENLNDLKVQFHLNRNYPSTSTLLIGTVDNVDEGFMSTFVPIDTIPYTNGINESQVTLYLTEYTGSATRLALRAIGPTYANQFVDDLVVDVITECIPPQHVTLAARTATSATLAWRVSHAAAYTVEYGPAGFTPGTGIVDSTNTLNITLTSLLPATTYDAYITAYCSDGSSSYPVLFTFTTLRGLPVTAYPYHCTFADSLECYSWELDNGTQTNCWSIGSAVHATGDDSLAMYVSNDGGASHNYLRTQTTHIYAYRTLQMTHTSYHISYDWIAKGEGIYDFMRVFLVPSSVTFTPGCNPSGTTTTNSYATEIPQGWIALDGGSRRNNVTSWQTFETDFDIPVSGNYYLLFYWLNDASGGTQPPAAVDNISITLRGCPVAEGLELTGATTNTLTVAWTEHPLAQQYVVEYGPAGFVPGTGTSDTVTGHIMTLLNLAPNTAYDLYVTTYCDDYWYSDSVASLLGISTLDLTYYTVTLLANDENLGTVAGGGTYAEGSEATITATPLAASHFNSWNDGNTDNPRTITVTQDTSFTALFAPDDTIGIEAADRLTFSLYPNPATGHVAITCGQHCEVLFMDIAGREVLRSVCNEGVTTIDVSVLAPGTYFVRMSDTSVSPVRKLIIK